MYPSRQINVLNIYFNNIWWIIKNISEYVGSLFSAADIMLIQTLVFTKSIRLHQHLSAFDPHPQNKETNNLVVLFYCSPLCTTQPKNIMNFAYQIRFADAFMYQRVHDADLIQSTMFDAVNEHAHTYAVYHCADRCEVNGIPWQTSTHTYSKPT